MLCMMFSELIPSSGLSESTIYSRRRLDIYFCTSSRWLMREDISKRRVTHVAQKRWAMLMHFFDSLGPQLDSSTVSSTKKSFQNIRVSIEIVSNIKKIDRHSLLLYTPLFSHPRTVYPSQGPKLNPNSPMWGSEFGVKCCCQT